LKVGVFGGTFDPVHTGHLIIAEEARVRLELDEVLFIPAGQPWFKAGQTITPAYHRLAMVELAVESNPYFRPSDMEITRPGPTYTVDTLLEVHHRLGPQATIYLILGTDSLGELHRWHQPQRLFDMATLVAVSRPGYQDFDPGTLDDICQGAAENVMMLNGPQVEITGASLRQRVAQGLSIKHLAPDSVEAYIHKHRLYVGKFTDRQRPQDLRDGAPTARQPL
jgi:nicotinate-nucleotide adenylyltransferase